MIGDRKPRRARRPLIRLILSLGAASLIVAWVLFGPPSSLGDPLAPLPTPTTVASYIPIPVPTATPSSTAIPALQLYYLGDTQHLDNIWLTPLKIAHVRKSDAYQLNDGEELLIVYLRIENRSNQNFTVNLGHFTLLDKSAGAIYAHLDNDPSRHRLRQVTLLPTGHAEGTVAFAAPIGRPVLELIYSPDILLPLHRKTWRLSTR